MPGGGGSLTYLGCGRAMALSIGEAFPIIACRAAASSLGGGARDSLLLIALSSAAGIASALAGGSKPPEVSTVPHSRGRSDIL